MRYAVAKIGGKQYRIKEGDKIEVDRLAGKEGETVEFKDVYLVVGDDKIEIGKPLVKGFKVLGKVIKHFLDEKVVILKFKAKTGYRRKGGFRAQKTLLEIEKISS